MKYSIAVRMFNDDFPHAQPVLSEIYTHYSFNSGTMFVFF
jgi:hypothetical protein